MPAFNKSENEAVVGTGLTNGLNGYRGDESMGTLFEGLGKTLQNGLNAFDESTNVQIEMAAYDGAQGVIDQNMPGGAGQEALPPGLQAGVDKMSGLSEARDQGAINEIQFQTGMVALAKNLKSQFPRGYHPRIDKAIASATSTNPSNDLRKAQLAAQASADEASNEAVKNYREFREADTNRQWYTQEETQAVFKGLTGRTIEEELMDPKLENKPALEIAIAKAQGVQTTLTMLDKKLEVDKKLTTKAAEQAYNDIIFEKVFSKEIGTPHGDLLAAVAQAQDPSSPGGVSIGPDEAAGIRTILANFNAQGSKLIADTIAKTGADMATRKAMQDDFDARAKTITDWVTNEKWGMLNLTKNAIEDINNTDTKNLLSGQVYRMYSSCLKNGGDPGSCELELAKVGGSKKLAEEIGRAFSANSLLTGDKSFSEVIKERSENDPNMSAAVDTVVKKVSNYLGSETLSAEGVANAAVNIYSNKNKDFLDHIDPKNRAGVFQVMLSPVIIEKLKKSGNQDALEFATAWGTEQLSAISNRAQDILFDAQRNVNGVDISFDGERFIIAPRNPNGADLVRKGATIATGGTMANMAGMVWDYSAVTEAQTAAADLTRYYQTMKPLWEAAGLDPVVAMGSVMKKDLDSIEKAPSLYESLGGAVWDYLSGGGEGKQSNAGAISGTAQAALPGGEKPATNAELTAQAKDRSIVGYSREIDPKDVQSTDQFLMSVLNKDKPQSYVTGLDDNFASSIAQLIQAAPPEIRKGLGIMSGARSVERQTQLWNAALKKYGSPAAARRWVAPPGRSMHNHGKAVDLAWNGQRLDDAPAWVIKWVHQNADQFGLSFPLGHENWHIEPKGSRSKKTKVANN